MKEDSVHKAYIGLGTNLGDLKLNLFIAMEELESDAVSISNISSIYESNAWGYQSGNSFYNMCLIIETHLGPLELLALFMRIETDSGRIRSDKGYADRIMDIDILLYDDLIFESDELILPHPKMQDRKFVLLPLAEIAADKIHPILNKTIGELADQCSDSIEVKRLSNE